MRVLVSVPPCALLLTFLLSFAHPIRLYLLPRIGSEHRQLVTPAVAVAVVVAGVVEEEQEAEAELPQLRGNPNQDDSGIPVYLKISHLYGTTNATHGTHILVSFFCNSKRKHPFSSVVPFLPPPFLFREFVVIRLRELR